MPTRTLLSFKEAILQGIPPEMPAAKNPDPKLSHAPKRKDILSLEEKELALKNALRYFPEAWHTERPYLYVSFSTRLRNKGATHFRLPRQLSAGSGHYADDSK
jgi:hypothetical protein